MNHSINFNYFEENNINFSISSQKNESVFHICKVHQNNKNIDANNNSNHAIKLINNTKISNKFSNWYNGVIKNLNFQGNGNISLNNDNINEKFWSKNQKDVKKETNPLNHKKKLRKINNYISKEKKENTLIKPILFEEKATSSSNYTKKDEIRSNKSENLFIFNNNKDFIFNKFNYYTSESINKNNNLKIYNNAKNSLAFPSIFKNINNINNTSFNLDNINRNNFTFKTNLNIPSFNFKNDFTLNGNFLKNNTFKNEVVFNEKLNLSEQCSHDLSLVEYNKNQDESKNKKIHLIVKYIDTRKGRKSKKSKINYDNYSESKHTKFSDDNMMRKIKNKVIESSRILVNKVFKDEINSGNIETNYMKQEFSKIKGAFSQELNIKYNLYFYQMKIKEIFSLELSNKYTAIEKNFNKELIDYIFSEDNKTFFIKTKVLLNMPFHQYYHDIFLGEKENWKNYFVIDLNDNKYQIENMLKIIENNEDNCENNTMYIKKINTLAHNYEKFFLSKKGRNVELGRKKEDWIKSLMRNITKEQYEYYLEQIKQYKNYYDKRYNKKADKILDKENKSNVNLYEKGKKIINDNKAYFECLTVNNSDSDFKKNKNDYNNFEVPEMMDSKLNNNKRIFFCCKKRKCNDFYKIH